MFDIAPSELLLVAVVALLVIGPKDLPLALRSVGRWMGKLRRMSNHFRAGIDTMIREAELAETEKEWRDRNARIMAEHPDAQAFDADASPFPAPVQAHQAEMEPLDRAGHPDAAAEAAIARAAPRKAPEHQGGGGEEAPRQTLPDPSEGRG